MRTTTTFLLSTFFLASLTLALAPASAGSGDDEDSRTPTPVQIVALDECDPTTFNAALGPDFCNNIALAAVFPTTTLTQLFTEAAAGTPDANWDFEPDTLTIKRGTPLIVVNQGGEPHTFTEVKTFGGGFIPGLNHGQPVAEECAAGFQGVPQGVGGVAVARTRILQGSQLQVAGLSKGEHHFQCCIHPWMRVTVNVK